jgi:hypothetical protein
VIADAYEVLSPAITGTALPASTTGAERPAASTEPSGRTG